VFSRARLYVQHRPRPARGTAASRAAVRGASERFDLTKLARRAALSGSMKTGHGYAAIRCVRFRLSPSSEWSSCSLSQGRRN